MKRIFSLLVFLFVINLCVNAQTPQLINYQAVVRNSLGNILPNKLVTFKISIIIGSALGTAVYEETHSKATNEFGLVNLKIGGGTVLSGTFSNIDWGLDTYFIKVDLDINAGTNYEFMGTTQLLSVPYSIYAEKAGNAIDDFDKDSLNEIQSINKVGNTVSLSKNGGSFTDSDVQTLALNNNQLSISSGNSVSIDADTTNELQNINKVGNVVTLSQNGGSFTDSDNQSLSLNGTQLLISNGNSVNIGGTVDLDYDPMNEIQNLSINNDTLKLSLANQVYLPYDRDSTNELQTITKNNNIVTLSKNGGSFTDSDNQNLSSTVNGTVRTINISNGTGATIDVADNDNSSTNELQTLSISNNYLNISNGNSVYMPFNFSFPDGTENMRPMFIDNLTSVPYTVPADSNLYITNIYATDMYSSLIQLIINSKVVCKRRMNLGFAGGVLYQPIIVGSNQQIEATQNDLVINCFLVKSTVTPITIYTTTPYTVPVGKNLFVLNIYIDNSSNDYLTINSKPIFRGYNYSVEMSLGIPIILKSGDVITSNLGSVVINGYLK